jgi:hypothetical protein
MAVKQMKIAALPIQLSEQYKFATDTLDPATRSF